MPFKKTSFPGLLIYKPYIFEDERGYFYESYNEKTFQDAGIHTHFVQDNQARSSYGVVRGLHYQKPPYGQTKLLRTIEGTIVDIVVDIRQGSPTFGKAFSIELSAENKKQLLVPAGFAHGYSVLSPTAEVVYKCDAFYNKSSEGGISFRDPDLKIDWQIPGDKMILSGKDQNYPCLQEIETPFFYEES